MTPAQPCQQQPEEEKPQTQELFWGRKRALTLPRHSAQHPPRSTERSPNGSQEVGAPCHGLQRRGGQNRCSLPRLHPSTGIGAQRPVGLWGSQGWHLLPASTRPQRREYRGSRSSCC